MKSIVSARMSTLMILAINAALGACASASHTSHPPVTAESNIEVCVIDTIAPGGMMALSAYHVHATNDTVILQPEGRVPISKALAGPKVLAQAGWITPRQPLQLMSSTGAVRFTPTGSPKVFAPGRITLLGMIRGLPVFANGSEAGGMRAEVEAMSARGVDLEKALQQRASLRRQVTRVRTLYIPTTLVGCVFQPFTRARAARR